MQTTKDKILLLFTTSFPFGAGEQFLETEINYLSEQFKAVKIFPLEIKGNKRTLPENVDIVVVDPFKAYSPARMLIKRHTKLLSLYLEIIWKSPDRYAYILRPGKYFVQMMHRLNAAEILANELIKHKREEIIAYSYWFNYWVSVLSFLKRVQFPGLCIITRIHGGDFDIAQKKKGHFFLFRYFEIQNINKIVSISQFGINYFKRNYPMSDKLLALSHLGVNEQGDNPLNQPSAFVIVSCSFIIELKRLDLIIEILKELDFEVHWVHFGNGDLMEEILAKSKKLPTNIKCEFKGFTPNTDVINYYKQTHVDLFINVSRIEGIPVSIMEAISFGIPAIGCSVGGVPEIVTPETGFLLPEFFDPKYVAKIISDYRNMPASGKLKFREGVKEFWKRKFNATKEYRTFINNYLNCT